jgi:DNA repair protein RadD
MKLRDYQEQAIASLRQAFKQKHQRVLLVAPTGAGKTVMFSYLTHQLTQRGNRVLLLAHRDFLLDQISETLSRFDIPHGFIASRRPLQLCHLAQVAGVHTVKTRTKRIAWRPDWIICDEAHHATAGSWNKILEAYPDAKVIGVTATPERLDGTGLESVFDEMVVGPTVASLMAQGFLSRVKYLSPQLIDTEDMKTRMGDFVHAEIERAVNTRGVTGHAVDFYTKTCANAPAIAFCASIAHSIAVAEGFRQAGYRWHALHSKATYAENRAAIEKLASGELHGISSCDIVSEGFDVPVVTAAILLRPTKSLGLHLQQIGRVLRPAPGKDCAIVIDHVGNVARNSAGQWVLNHGRAEDPREWSLQGAEKKEKAAPLKRCDNCLAIIPVASRVCPECGHEFQAVPRAELKQLEGELSQLPAWIPPKCYGHKSKIIQTVQDSREPGWDLANRLIPEIPDNVYSRNNCLTLRGNACIALCDYIAKVKQEEHPENEWNVFDEAYGAYMRVITAAMSAAARTLEDFQHIAELNGYKPGWAYYRWQNSKYARK